MRYTPYLDSLGITFKSYDDMDDELIDYLVNVIDNLLGRINSLIDWGVDPRRESQTYGWKRKPCPEQPILLTGKPIGQYHCPVCMEMQMAALPHLPPDSDYERMTGQEWPMGYEPPDELIPPPPPADHSGDRI